MVGVGTGVANIAEWGSFNMTFAIATLVSIDAGTVYGLTVQMMGVIFMIYVGMGTATSVRVAERFGRGRCGGRARGVAAGRGCVDGAGPADWRGALILLRDPIAVTWLNGSEVASAGAHLVPLLSIMLAAVAFVTLFDGLAGCRLDGAAGAGRGVDSDGDPCRQLCVRDAAAVLVAGAAHRLWRVGRHHRDFGRLASLRALGQVLALEWRSARGVRGSDLPKDVRPAAGRSLSSHARKRRAVSV